MNYRLATIHPRENYTADKEEKIDIDITDAISQIVITYETVNGGQAYGDGHPARCISKIELVDGSDVLFSLSGVEAQAVDYYDNKRETANIVLYTNGMNNESIFNINFGRYLYDAELALDPTRFTNLQLKISIDVDGGGSLSTSGYLTVMAHLFDEKTISPIGFLMHKEVKSYTLANDSYEYTDLPTDYWYRKMFIRAQRYGTGPEYQIDEVKLSEDTDKKIPLNHTMFQLLRVLTSQVKPYREWIIGPGSATAQYFYCTPTYWPAFSGAQWRASIGGGEICFYSGDGGRFQEVQTASGPNWQAHVEGWAPHGVIEIPFGMKRDITDWYDVTRIGNLKLTLKGGSSVGTGQTAEIFLQQLRRY